MNIKQRYKLTISYDGFGFHGWQIQPRHETIQNSVEKALHQLTHETIRLHSAGRTDAGVHALGQVAHFTSVFKLNLKAWKIALNQNLPKSIRIVKVQKVQSDFHARYQAKSKTYRYTIFIGPDLPVLSRHQLIHSPHPLNLHKMRLASKHLIGKKNFSSFGANAQRKEKENPIKQMKKITLKRHQNYVTIDITASGFLYKMARRIAGTLLRVGRGRINPNEIPIILKSKDPGKAGPTAPAHGLCLIEVKY